MTSRVAVSGNIPTATPEEFAVPIKRYKHYVRTQLASMQQDLDRLESAIEHADLPAARRAWLAADEAYESIGAAYGAFGDLDARINGRPGHLIGGERSQRFTGLHRVELALWERKSTVDARASADLLDRDVAALRASLVRMKIDPFEYSLRSHEVIEDTLHLQLAGVANRWSDAPLVALRGNLQGTTLVYGTLRASVRRRNPAIATRAEQGIDALDRAIGSLERSNGTLPTWSALPIRERERLNALTASLAERLAYVPELVDPRPPRSPLRALGTKVGS